MLLLKVIAKNPIKNKLEYLQLLFNKLKRIQEGLQDIYQQNISLRD
jgi:hypothetical protein